MEREGELVIYYVVVGAFLEEFVVILKSSEDVAALTLAIKEASIGLDDVDLDELELYLAQQPTGGWLPCDSDELKAPKEGDEALRCDHVGSEEYSRSRRHQLQDDSGRATPTQPRSEVELWCLVVGDGTSVFPVIIKKLALIQDLQWRLKMRIYRYALDVREETINIYEAIDEHGNSLKSYSPEVATLRAGNEEVADRLLRKKLDPLKTIAEVFHDFEEHTVHFLALPPSKFDVSEYERSWSSSDSDDEAPSEYVRSWTPTEPYEDAAEFLKSSQEVSELVTIVNGLASLKNDRPDTIPFIMLASSSGAGKTQLAFNLMARDDLDVFCFACVNDGEVVRLAFCYRSSAFIQCVDKDIREVGEAGVFEISQQSELYTYAFIRTLLSDLPGFTGTRTRAEVLDAINARRARGRHCVFFLDDYPHIDNSMSEEEKNLWTRKMRFKRNVFRSFGLVVIVTASNKAAKSLLTTAVKTQTDDELWCVVYPLLPRFEDPSMKSLPSAIQTIITSSWPLFATLAMEYVSSKPFDECADVAKYLDAMVQSLAQAFVYGGRYTPEKFNDSVSRVQLQEEQQ